MTVDRFRSSVRRVSGQDRWRSVTLSLLLAVLAGALAVLAAPAAVDAFSAVPRDAGPSLSPQQELPDGPGFNTTQQVSHDLEIVNIRFQGEPNGDFYENDELISVEVQFNQFVDQGGLRDELVTLQLTLGDRQVTMAGTFDGDYAYFHHEVERGDYDGDGVDVLANSMSGTISTDTHNVDASTLTHEGLEGGDGHKVNLLVVNSLTIGPNPRDNGAYFTGNSIRIHANFNMSLQQELSSGPSSWIALQVGDNERLVEIRAGGQGSLFYYYQVRADDIDEDGVSLAENPFRGVIYANGRLATFADEVSHPGVSASTGHLVNPQIDIESIEITSEPGPNDFYIAGQDIEITVTFNDNVDITLDPEGALPTIKIGLDGSNRLATARISDAVTTVSSPQASLLAPSNLRAAISVSGDSVRLQWNAPVADAGSVSAYRFTRTTTEANGTQLSSYIYAPATARAFTDIYADVTASTYTYQVQAMRGEVASDASNEVTVGVGLARSTYNSNTISFTYTVAEEDTSANGVMIRRNSLSANGAEILYADNDRPVNLLHRVVSPNPDHTVTGTPGITNVEIVSEPASERGYYLLDEEVFIEVTFEAPVRLVDGAEALPAISGVLDDGQDGRGMERRSFTYHSGSGSDTWLFSLIVTPGESAYIGLSTDAIGSRRNWLPGLVETMNSGAVDATFAALPLDPNQRIYAGAVATDVTVTSTPENGREYRIGEKFLFTITFDLTLSVEVEMKIDLQVGSNTRRASLVPRGYRGYIVTPTFDYQYTFTDTDADADGIEILDTASRDEDGGDGNGYHFMSFEFRHAGIWEFINPSPGVLSDHKVVGSDTEDEASEHLSWLPTEE